MLAFAIFITHGLACYVAIDITWNDYVAKKLGPQRSKLFWEYVVRTLLVLVTCKFWWVLIISEVFFHWLFCFCFTVLLAVAIPNLELFISLFGALCLSALGLGFPALIQISTHWYNTHGKAKIWLILSKYIKSIKT